MTSLTRVSLLAVGLASLGLAGCSSVKLDNSGSMIAVFQFGEFRMLLNSTAPAAADVAQKVLPQFDLFQTSFEKTTYSAKILARNRSDQQIIVEIEEINSRQSMLRIRWGAGGDLTRSRRLYEAIEAGLPVH